MAYLHHVLDLQFDDCAEQKIFGLVDVVGWLVGVRNHQTIRIYEVSPHGDSQILCWNWMIFFEVPMFVGCGGRHLHKLLHQRPEIIQKSDLSLGGGKETPTPYIKPTIFGGRKMP